MLPLWVRQTVAQVQKNWTIHWRRHWLTTSNRAFLLPVIFVAFISFSKYLFVQPAEYGIGKPEPVLGLQEAMGKLPNKKFLFVTNGLSGDVDTVVENVQKMVSGGNFMVVDSVEEMRKECRQSLQGVSRCFAAVVFENSPDGGDDGKWKYTLRADSALTLNSLLAEDHDNDIQE